MKLFCAVVLLAASAVADVVTDWNTALDAIRAGNTPPPAAARNLAILHASIYDAVNGIRTPYFVTATGPDNASIEAAAAARRVMLSLYSSLQTQIEAEYQNSLRRIPDSAGRVKESSGANPSP